MDCQHQFHLSSCMFHNDNGWRIDILLFALNHYNWVLQDQTIHQFIGTRFDTIQLCLTHVRCCKNARDGLWKHCQSSCQRQFHSEMIFFFFFFFLQICCRKDVRVSERGQVNIRVCENCWRPWWGKQLLSFSSPCSLVSHRKIAMG